MVSSDFLYRNYNEPEGIMTSWRAALVRTESIGAAGKELGYEPLVRLSKGEKHGSERAHDVILADCFEAVIGAIYLDQGYETAKDFIYKHILNKIDEILEDESWRDPKSYFQELAQKNAGVTPVYRTLKEEGPDHDKSFTVGVYVADELKGTGVGHSKQEAQTAAAKEGVKSYKAAEKAAKTAK
jgi:ribonuclease-3